MSELKIGVRNQIYCLLYLLSSFLFECFMESLCPKIKYEMKIAVPGPNGYDASKKLTISNMKIQ